MKEQDNTKQTENSSNAGHSLYKMTGGASLTPPPYTLGSNSSQKSNNTAGITSQKSMAGLSSAEAEDQFVGGRTFGEFMGDIARPIGTGLGNAVGAVAGALSGVSISSTTNSPATWNNHGHFDWRVGFSTTGTNGWIVQKITNTYRAEDTAGNPVAGPAPTPEYWEAWAVDASGNISPSVGANHDYWIRANKGTGTQGHWSMKGKCYFTTVDPATSGLTPGGVPDAGILLSGTSAPGGLGVARLHRYAQGTWDSTGTTPTHTGSAA